AAVTEVGTRQRRFLRGVGFRGRTCDLFVSGGHGRRVRGEVDVLLTERGQHPDVRVAVGWDLVVLVFDLQPQVHSARADRDVLDRTDLNTSVGDAAAVEKARGSGNPDVHRVGL